MTLPMLGLLAPLVGVHPIALGARVDPQIPGDLRDRLTGLPDQPDRALPEPWSNFLRVSAIAVLL
jgi:hypothetical protein